VVDTVSERIRWGRRGPGATRAGGPRDPPVDAVEQDRDGGDHGEVDGRPPLGCGRDQGDHRPHQDAAGPGHPIRDAHPRRPVPGERSDDQGVAQQTVAGTQDESEAAGRRGQGEHGERRALREHGDSPAASNQIHPHLVSPYDGKTIRGAERFTGSPGAGAGAA